MKINTDNIHVFKMHSKDMYWVWDVNTKKAFWVNKTDGEIREISKIVLDDVLKGIFRGVEIPIPESWKQSKPAPPKLETTKITTFIFRGVRFENVTKEELTQLQNLFLMGEIDVKDYIKLVHKNGFNDSTDYVLVNTKTKKALLVKKGSYKLIPYPYDLAMKWYNKGDWIEKSK